ncbi:copper chaperone PCu(A)C [Shewanella maritima]|uniref:copper chaperone PCu(A)C n=1 Tax=Shewanella maritima TaxID=2520507 RepID=UPI003735C1DB
MEFKTLKIIFKHLFKFIAVASFSIPAFANIITTDGYVRAMPPSVPNTAAYLTIQNHGDKPVKLIAVKTDAAAKAEIHTIVEENGMVKMRQIPHIEIASHGAKKLKPSAEHIMLLSLTSPLKEHDKVKLQLIFEDLEAVDVELPVMKKAVESADAHHHHHH